MQYLMKGILMLTAILVSSQAFANGYYYNERQKQETQREIQRAIQREHDKEALRRQGVQPGELYDNNWSGRLSD